MYPKHLPCSANYPYKSKIIKELTLREGAFEKTVWHLDKKIFYLMQEIYIKTKKADKKATADRLKQYSKSGKDVNNGTNEFLKKAQRLEAIFLQEYGDFYNDFVRWKSGPGIQRHPVFNFDIVSNHPASVRLLNEFSIAVRQYELGIGDPERQYYQREARLKEIILKAEKAFDKCGNKENKKAFLYDYVKKNAPKLLRDNADRATEEERLRQLLRKANIK